jgi:hypothetical protein
MWGVPALYSDFQKIEGSQLKDLLGTYAQTSLFIFKIIITIIITFN